MQQNGETLASQCNLAGSWHLQKDSLFENIGEWWVDHAACDLGLAWLIRFLANRKVGSLRRLVLGPDCQADERLRNDTRE